jgi:hypothetical protein
VPRSAPKEDRSLAMIHPCFCFSTNMRRACLPEFYRFGFRHYR